MPVAEAGTLDLLKGDVNHPVQCGHVSSLYCRDRGRAVIHPSHGVRIFVATKPIGFRKVHDGLAALVQSHLLKKPFDGAVYVFRAKRVDRLKMIWWDGTGLVMAYRRLEQNAFK